MVNVGLSLRADTLRETSYSSKCYVLLLLTSVRSHLHHLRTRSRVGIAQSVQGHATGWTVRGSKPGVGEIFRARSDRPWGLPTLVHNGYRISFPGVKCQGRDVSPSSAKVKERV
jgi:hypothetical protein